MNRDLLLAILTAMLVVVAVIAAIPSLRRDRGAASRLGRIGNPLASGVFLGAGLVHLLPDAAQHYATLGIAFPWPFVLCGATALALATLEQNRDRERGAASSALFAAAALSVHGLLAGAALGATQRQGAVLVLFLALIAHKGAASFSLSRLLAESGLSRVRAITVQAIFVLALPVGVVLGEAETHRQAGWPLAMPLTLAVGAGTFLYFGTMHRARSEGRPQDSRPLLVVSGFTFMALIAAVS